LTKEFTFSGGGQLGSRGYAKVTYINRHASDFIEDFFTIDGGTTEVIQDGQSFGTFTNQVFKNTELLNRDYDALKVQTRYQVTDNFMVDGSYTVDALGIPTTVVEGARFGEATSPNDYPQYLPNLDGLRAFQLAFGLRW